MQNAGKGDRQPPQTQLLRLPVRVLAVIFFVQLPQTHRPVCSNGFICPRNSSDFKRTLMQTLPFQLGKLELVYRAAAASFLKQNSYIGKIQENATGKNTFKSFERIKQFVWLTRISPMFLL